jgi:hypothetical protein
LGGRVIPTVFDQQLSKFGFEVHPRIPVEHFLDDLRRHLIKA